MKQNILTIDRLPINSAKRHINDAGYLVAPNSSVARSGILQYSAKSIGMAGSGIDPNKMINVYRPPSEVLKIKDCYANMPLTLQHPDALEVTTSTARGLTAGHSGSNVKVNNLPGGEVEILVDIIVIDKESIQGVQSGKTEELSVGYNAAYKRQSGTSPDGTPYEVIQFNLVPNHIALVDEGRCGSMCKVADQKNKEVNKMKEIEIAGQRFKVDDALRAALQTVMDGDETELNGKKVDAAEMKFKPADMSDEEYTEVMKKKPADMDEESFMKSLKKKKTEDELPDPKKEEKKVGDSAEGKLFKIEVKGKQVVVDAAGLALLSSLEDSEEVAVVDNMEVAKVTNQANKILGPDFDINTCDSLESIKKAIIKKVMPVVGDSNLADSASVNVLYSAACDTFKSKSDHFNKDQMFLSGAADGTELNGGKAVSPFAGMISLGRAAASSVVADAKDPHSNRKIKFIGGE